MRTSEQTVESRRLAFAVSCLYFVSGLSGLVYEVTFSKYLSYVFGATAYASSAVLVAFMGGLSVGGALVARWNARLTRRLFSYGAAEILVGGFCVISPLLFWLIGRAYVALSHSLPQSLPLIVLLRWLLATTVVFVPAAGMGATLPLLAAMAPGLGSGRWLSRLYALNVSGGALGSLLGAYAIVPSLGLRGTLRWTALLNVVIGASAMILGRRGADETPEPAREVLGLRESPGWPGLWLVAAGSGVLVFASEVVFVHLLALVIGTSVYAFGLMLAIFLVCLGLGAWLGPPIFSREPWGVPAAAATAGLVLAATVPLWDRLPGLFDAMGPYATSWALREGGRALVAFLALAAPATAMGTLFPLVLRELAPRPQVGAEVGKIAAINTLGSIVGSVAGGFVLLPQLGSQRSLLAIAASYAVLALVAMRGRGARRPVASRALWAVSLATFVTCLAVPRWDLGRLTSGANVYFESGPEPDAIEMVREDIHGGVTTVVRAGDILTLYTNGKFQGNNGYEVDAQRAFAHIPCLLTERHERAFVIGLGTGTTVGTLAAYPFARIEVAEISPAIVHAARAYFSDINRGALNEPRVSLVNEDGRNALLVSGEQYDVVGIEISSIWFAGAANVYSREFYELVRDRLAPGGVLQQWVQFHHIRRRELASVLATVRSVFPHVALYAHGNQGIIVGGRRELVMSRARAEALGARPSIARLREEGRSLADLAGDLLVMDDTLDRFLADSSGSNVDLVSTDDNLYLEYATPKNNVAGMPSIEETIGMVASYRAPDVLAKHLVP
ncbi:MAG TPA: fused MFS/spermidine synthase [Polyangiaceae bacterium]